MVSCHFRVPLQGDPYWENRQAVLMAINRAVKKHSVEFAELVLLEDTMRTQWRAISSSSSSSTRNTANGDHSSSMDS